MNVIEQFMPLMQQAIVNDAPNAYKDEVERLELQIHMIPDKRQVETAYAHFFYGGCDWYVLAWDRDNLVYCCTMMNSNYHEEYGDLFLSDFLENGKVELDFHWEKQPLAQALYDKYPDLFPNPKDEKQKPLI